MKRFDLSERLQKLPPYLFAQIDRAKGKLREKGIPLIDLSIGDPDILAPRKILEIMYRSAKIKDNQKYALDQGKLLLRRAIKKWFKKRFKVSLNVEREILPLLGSKEGLVHFPLAFVNAGDYVIIPSPGYPGYKGAALFAGARIYELPLLEGSSFLPELKKIPLSMRNKAKVIYLNYPNNPTTAVAPESFLRGLVRFCAKYGIIIAYDNAYSEIYFDEKPPSILQIKGAREVALEFHSFSKTFCMTGFRIGWACGNDQLISGLIKVKTNIDSGVFGALQDAAAYALENETAYIERLREIMGQRRVIFTAGLKEKGLSKLYAESTFYAWAKLPQGYTSSIEFSRRLLRKGVVTTPGVGFGKYGEGFVRFALTVDKEMLKRAAALLSTYAPTR